MTIFSMIVDANLKKENTLAQDIQIYSYKVTSRLSVDIAHEGLTLIYSLLVHIVPRYEKRIIHHCCCL